MRLSLFSLTALTVVAAELTGLSYPYETQEAFIADMLAQHNAYRALHSAPAVTWNSTLAEAALANAASGTWAHTSDDPYGENIATGTYTDPDYYGYLWYAEGSLYDYSNPGYSDATGHFTQMVWVSTTEIGCAVSNVENNLGLPYSMTCEYYPPGNIINEGYFAANVLPLASTSAAGSVKATMTSLLAAVAAGAYILL